MPFFNFFKHNNLQYGLRQTALPGLFATISPCAVCAYAQLDAEITSPRHTHTMHMHMENPPSHYLLSVLRTWQTDVIGLPACPGEIPRLPVS
eukprot:1054163-Pleurochrysis_carterae.AAC.3